MIPELDTSTLLSLGELVEPSLVFQEFQDQVLTDLVKPLSVTCVDQVECSLPYTHGEDGLEELILNKKDTPLLPLLPLPVLFL